MNRDYIMNLFPELHAIKDETLKDKVARTWLLALDESDWEKIEDMPWIPGVAEFITNVEHCRGTAKIAIALSKALTEQEGVELNLDHVIAGGILHDVGKLLEHSARGGKTEAGKHLPHPQLGTHICLRAGLPVEVVNIVQYHNTPGEIPVRTLELEIIRAMDACHADSMLRKHAGLTLRDVFPRATPEPVKK